jgi:hypothetical protein
MKLKNVLITTVFSVAIASMTRTAGAQAAPAGAQQLQLSAFLAGTGTFTDFHGGKNLAITAGGDLTFLHYSLFRPALEIRGTVPVDSGHISSQKSILIGPKVEFPLGRYHPYADFLIGRGAIDYLNGGFTVPTLGLIYLSSNSTVYSYGGGLDYNLSHSIALKIDAQYQHWDAPPADTGVIHPAAVTFGAVYNFDFNPRHRHER